MEEELRWTDLKANQITKPQKIGHYQTPVRMHDGSLRYCCTPIKLIDDSSSSSSPKRNNVTRVTLTTQQEQQKTDEEQMEIEEEEAIENHLDSQNNSSPLTNPQPPIDFSQEFMKKLEESMTNASNIQVSDNKQFILLKETKCGYYSALEICFAILVFLCYCNLPMAYYSPLVSLIGLFLPPGSLSIIPNTQTKFFSKFFDLFCSSAPEKQIVSVKGIGTMEMQFYDLEKKLQEKFNLKSYRQLLLEGKLRIIERFKSKAHEKELTDINDGLVHVNYFKRFLCNCCNFVFQLFLDGVSPFTGSNESLIPAYLVNCQIDLDNRFRIENMIMIGMVSLRGLHHEDQYFEKLVSKLNEKLQGFKIALGGIIFKCQGIVSSLIVDTVELENIFKLSSGLQCI